MLIIGLDSYSTVCRLKWHATLGVFRSHVDDAYIHDVCVCVAVWSIHGEMVS